jgi:hypothetical protein
MARLEEDVATTVAQFEAKLRMREHELTYTAPWNGSEYEIKTLPTDKVMAILLSKYAPDTPLTATMLTSINWLESKPVDRPYSNHFHASDDHPSNIEGQLVAVLTNTAMPELERDYTYTDTRVPPKKCPLCKTPATAAMSTVPAETPEATQAPVHTEAPTTIDTYVDERRSYCESCDTYKKGVQWWTTAFETSKPPLITIGGRNDKRKVMSACKACVEHVPKIQRDMKPAW